MKHKPIFLTAFVALLSVTFSNYAGAAPLSKKLEGVWASVGYGRLLEVKGNMMKMYHVTDVSCVLDMQVPLAGFAHKISRIDVSQGDEFSFYGEGGMTRYDYTQRSKLPKNCTDKQNLDPELNFDVFWHAFNEHYAFFDLRGVDWDEVYRTYRPKVTKDTTPAELQNLMTEVIKSTGDAHINLYVEGGKRINAGNVRTLRALLQKDHQGQGQTTASIIPASKAVIEQHYLKNTKREATNDGRITWGWAADGIGYVSIDKMSGYLDKGTSLTKTLRYLDEVMEHVLTDLEAAKAFIVDTRWNSGGHDANALRIAAYFTDQQLLAFTKMAKNGDGYALRQRTYIPNHAAKRFAGPVVYLSGNDTYSAAEIFAMAMQAIPTVTSMGEHTGGILSDKLNHKLPNGWTVSLSNEIYLASDGELYEGRGIPVDVVLPKNEDVTFEGFLKLGMDQAIAHLRAQR